MAYSSPDNQIKAIKNYVHQLFSEDPTGHDFYHMKRVAKLSKSIAHQEGANVFVAEAGGWLHDIGDVKLFANPSEAKEDMASFLHKIKIDEEIALQIINAIKDISFRNGKIPDSLEGKIIQDADRLDAIGAIGIARTFAYGGAKGQLLYDSKNPQDTSIQHFHDKLLLLKDGMNTSFARVLAEERHAFMEEFLERFYKDW